jgi:hypothetical protein
VLAIDQEREESMNTKMSLFVRGNRATGWWFAIASILVTAAALLLAAPVHAQSAAAEPAALTGAGAAPPPAIADPPADVPIDTVAPIAAAGDTSASNDSAAKHSGWVRVGDDDDDYGYGDSGDSVLEIPRVVHSAEAHSPRRARQPAPSDASPSPDQIGSIGDYQDNDDYDFGGLYTLPIGAMFGPGTFGTNLRSPNPSFRPGFNSRPQFGPTLGRPGMNGMNTAIGSTSPMMPGPGSLAPMPGGWSMGGH